MTGIRGAKEGQASTWLGRVGPGLRPKAGTKATASIIPGAWPCSALTGQRLLGQQGRRK